MTTTSIRAAWVALLLIACDGDNGKETTDDTLEETDTVEDSDPTGDDTDPPPDCVPLSDGTCVYETFANPPVLRPDSEGVYQLTLAASEVQLAGERHCVRTYNGHYTGPTLDIPARQGATARQIRLDMHNDLVGSSFHTLEGQTCTCTDWAGFACNPTADHTCGDHDAHDDCTCVDEEGDACEHVFDFNVTNLHFHGSHIEPDYANGGGCTPDGGARCRDCDGDVCDGPEDDTCFYSDDVLTQVPSGSGTRHRFDLDEDGTHHEGLFWYHPHIHGTTALQVGSGAAGAIIVRGPLDEVPGLAEARERVMVFSTPPIGSEDGFQPLAEGEPCSESSITFDSFLTLNAFGFIQKNLINGQEKPRLITAPGQVERWRVVHGGFLDEVFLGVFRGEDTSCQAWSTEPEDTLTVRQIARDGIILPQVFDSDWMFMSPGYRIEAVFGGDQLRDGDTWCLISARFLQDREGALVGPPQMPTPSLIRAGFAQGNLTAILNVDADAGEPTTTTLPDPAAITALAPSTVLDGVSAEDRCEAAAQVDDEDEIDQLAVLQVGFFTADDPDPCDCDNYNINCRNFEETDRSVYPYDRDLVLDKVDHWRLAASFDGHPFHIHTNPVILCPNENPFDPLPFPHWRDTYLVNLTRQVDALAWYKRFEGPHVLHCHKLTHEDHGMMEVLRTCDAASDPTCGDYTWKSCAPGDLVCEQKLAATMCALGAGTEAESVACSLQLAGPLGICGPNACAGDDECGPNATCDDFVCRPDGPPFP